MKQSDTRKPDYVLLIAVLGLTVFGLLMISSAGSILSYERFGDSFFYVRHQLLYGVLPGLVALLVFSRIKYDFWKNNAFYLMVASIGLLILVFIPGVGTDLGRGAYSWINLGFTTFQPAEMVKLTFMLYLAAWLTKRGTELTQLKKGLLPFVVVLGFVGVLVMLQPDLGTLSVIGATAIIMYFAAGASLAHMGILAVGGSALFWLMATVSPYRLQRITSFLHPELDPQGIGYQVNQALLAIGSGGWLGLGLGNSRQKFNYLPEVIGDSIFAVTGEELGFVLSVILILVFVLIASRGLRIAKEAPDTFSRLVAVGITGWIVFQAGVNIGGMLTILPLTGLPLPFISYGGTSMIMMLAAMGILMNISKYTKQSKEQPFHMFAKRKQRAL